MTDRLSCVIVDDEQGAVEVLEGYVKKVAWLELVNSFTDPLEALDYLRANRVDLVMLDINMPDLSGMQLSRLLQANDVAVIFCTAYPQHAVESYEVEALDYLVKPVPFDRFLQAVSKLKKEQETTGPAVPQRNLLYIKSGSEIHTVASSEIRYLQKDGHYMVFKLGDREILSRMTMTEALEALPSEKFIQVHRSYIVSLDHIKIIQRHFVQLGTSEIPVGDNYREAFFSRVKYSGN